VFAAADFYKEFLSVKNISVDKEYTKIALSFTPPVNCLASPRSGFNQRRFSLNNFAFRTDGKKYSLAVRNLVTRP
jgi:hypothetical protein